MVGGSTLVLLARFRVGSTWRIGAKAAMGLLRSLMG